MDRYIFSCFCKEGDVGELPFLVDSRNFVYLKLADYSVGVISARKVTIDITLEHRDKES